MIKKLWQDTASARVKEIILVKMKMTKQFFAKINFSKHGFDGFSQKFSQFEIVYIFLEYSFLEILSNDASAYL